MLEFCDLAATCTAMVLAAFVMLHPGFCVYGLLQA